MWAPVARRLDVIGLARWLTEEVGDAEFSRTRQLADLERRLRTDDPDLVRKSVEGIHGGRLGGRPGRDRLLEAILGLLILLGAVAILLGSATGAMQCVLAAGVTARARYRRRKVPPRRP